jgi:putative transposase
MPRLPRLIVPEVAVHVVQRGNNRQACFREDSDYLVYLLHMRDLSIKKHCAVHAYCLMTNHVHLLLTPREAPSCAALMRDLGQRYVQYFNRRYARTGTLWEGRFRSCLVESAQYVLACHRYIELNPVRAGIAASAPAYRWSSHAGNTGAVHNKMLSPHAEYLALSDNEASRHAAYRQLFEQGDELAFLTAVRDATNGGYALIGDQLKSQLAANGERRIERGKPGRPADPVDMDPTSGELGL